MKKLGILISVSALFAACSQPELTDETLLGCWENVDEKQLECWEQKGDTLVGKGLAIVTKDDGVTDTVQWEALKLYTENGVRKYQSTVRGQGPVTFTETEPWVFENPEHDFPKRLIYDMDKDGRMVITVGEGERAFTYFFVKR